jgi:2-methylcitrate dehydratase PrpD
VTSILRNSRLTEQVATYSLGTGFAALPDNVVDCTKRVVLDTLGCIVLGSTIDAGRIMGNYVRAVAGRADASVIGGGMSAPAGYAALANGTAAHADELDASHISWGHPASVAIPMALAMSETIGADGKEFINAIVLAHDFGGRFVQAAGGRREIQETRHSHSSVLYAVAAAAAAGRLLRLQPLALHHAMALAMFNISSPAAFMDERKHMTKAMAHGQSAFAGVSGALLASCGFEANDNVLEARHGLADFWFADDSAIPEVTAELGKYFSITDTGFKYYSAGYPIHAPLYNSLKIVRENGLAVADIQTITVGMASHAADIVDSRDMPSICIQDMLSLGVVLGRLSFEDAHDTEALARPEVRELRGKIRIERDPELDGMSPPFRGAWVRIQTLDGRHFERPAQLAPGHWELGGAPWADVEAKFTQLVEPRLGAETAARVIDLTHDLERLGNLSELGRLLRGATV